MAPLSVYYFFPFCVYAKNFLTRMLKSVAAVVFSVNPSPIVHFLGRYHPSLDLSAMPVAGPCNLFIMTVPRLAELCHHCIHQSVVV